MIEELDIFSQLTINDDGHKGRLLVPKCRDMCSAEERRFRERNGLLHRLELCHLSDWDMYMGSHRKKTARTDRIAEFAVPKKVGGFTDQTRAVKQFKRSSAGENLMLGEEIRPTETLKLTIDYLCFDLIERAKEIKGMKTINIFGHYYDFVFDRLRSIRQDLVLQRAFDSNCLYLLERCIEFYLSSYYCYLIFKSKESREDVQSLERHFSVAINSKHLIECLSLLMKFYDHFQDYLWSRSRPLFETINLLADLDNFERNERFLALRKVSKSKDLLDCNLIRVTERLRADYLTGNMIKCLRLGRRCLPKAQLYSIAFYVLALPRIHLKLVQQICVGYRSPRTQVPVDTLIDWFCPQPADRRRCRGYIITLFSSFGIPIESQADAFNNPENEEDSQANLILTNKFTNIEQWQPPAGLSPAGWLPVHTKFYRMFVECP